MTAFNLPNTLTAARIVLIPVFVTSIMYGRYDYALYLFAIAALTDALDGLIARLKHQKTALGTLLDPIADKFLLVTSFVLFSIYGLIPTWFSVMIISRDIIIVTGWIILYFVMHTSRVEPSALGKAAIALQLLLISYILLNINFPELPDIEGYIIRITSVFTIVSGLHYIYRALKQSNA